MYITYVLFSCVLSNKMDPSKIYWKICKDFPYHYLFRSVIELAGRFVEEYESDIKWFTYNQSEEIWIKHDFSLEIKLPPKMDWYLVSILGELYLLLSNDTFKYHSKTKTWKSTKILSNVPIDGIKFLTLAYEHQWNEKIDCLLKNIYVWKIDFYS